MPWASFLLSACLFATVSLPRCVAVEMDVYILTGQSNSLGTTAFEGDTADDFGPGVDPGDEFSELFWSNVSAGNTIYPPHLYGDSGDAIAHLQMQQGDANNPTFWGPEFGLARSLFANNGPENVLTIKASRGGGGNTFWDQNAFENSADSGHMWGHLRDTVDAALSVVVARGDTFNVKGLLYLQGESNNSAEAAASGVRLQSLIGNIKTHIEDQYAGTTNELRTVVAEIAASQSNANRQLTAQQHLDLATSDDDIAFVPTRHLELKQDGIHFGKEAKLTIGYQFSIALLDMEQLPNGIAGDVNQDGTLLGDGTGAPEIDDISAFLVGWRADTSLLSSVNKTLHGDLDLSGRTDLADAFLMHQALAAQGQEFPFDLLVPEPAAVSLAAWLFGLVFASRRKRRPFRQIARG